MSGPSRNPFVATNLATIEVRSVSINTVLISRQSDILIKSIIQYPIYNMNREAFIYNGGFFLGLGQPSNH